MNVWTYWAGPMPPWIKTCLDTVRRCSEGCDFHLLTPETVPTESTIFLHPKWRTLPPGVGTDCLRAALLAKHGGLWVDADTVCIRPLRLLFEERHLPTEFLFSRWQRTGRAMAGYVHSPANHPVAVRWRRFCNAALELADRVGWGDLGEKVLTLILDGCAKDRWEMPLETFMPIDIDNLPFRYHQPGDWRVFVGPRTVAFGLNHSAIMQCKPNFIDDKGSVLSQLLRDAEYAEQAGKRLLD